MRLKLASEKFIRPNFCHFVQVHYPSFIIHGTKKNVYIKLLSVWEDIMKLIAGKHLEHHKLYPWSLIKLFPMEKKKRIQEVELERALR